MRKRNIPIQSTSLQVLLGVRDRIQSVADHHDLAEILLNVALNTFTITQSIAGILYLNKDRCSHTIVFTMEFLIYYLTHMEP